ncbi:MAG: hypothetical protein QG597_3087 [Actinomycetota bacterium]|nr:hypothetical protein [Actinomycetota bacterium]
MPLFQFPESPDGTIPTQFRTEPQQLRQRISTLGGWRAFVDRTHPRPRRLTPQQFDRLSDGERGQYDDARAAFHRSLTLVEHKQLVAAWEQIDHLTVGSYADDGARQGIALSGGAGYGKTTIAVGYARRYEIAVRQAYPSAFDQENLFVPVCYSALLPNAGLKANMQHILSFYGEPSRSRETGPQLLERLTTVTRVCRTQLLILDQAQNLREGNKRDDEVAAHLKHILDDAGCTLMLVGIDLDARGPLSIPRAGGGGDRLQLARRFRLIKIETLASGSPEWRSLLTTMENRLILVRSRPGDLSERLSDTLWDLSGGAIGVAFNIVNVAANTAISSGTERITRTVLTSDAPTAAHHQGHA